MTVKSTKRTQLLNAIVDNLTSHEIFSDNVKRDKDTEKAIQKSLFLRLEKSALRPILTESFGVNESKIDDILNKHFKYEQDTQTVVNHFSMFATQHRPDAILELDDLRIAIEIKKGDNGAAIRSAIGQSVLYSKEFDFVIVVMVDTTPGRDIKNSVSGKREHDIITELWDRNNTMFIVV